MNINGYYIKKTKENLENIVKIKKDLTVTPYGPPQFMKDNKPFTVFIENEKEIIIPRYFAQTHLNIPMKFKSINNTDVPINFIGKLRDLQEKIMEGVCNKIKQTKGGMISLPCGFGKTVCSLYLASKLKKKTLVIVHKSFLMNQWKERIEQFIGCKVGHIQQDKVEIEGCDIVIGMLQSISKSKYTAELFKNFGLVIFDEAHHAPSRYFSKALPIISTEYMVALSATPKRSDKLEKIIEWYFGPILYKIEDTRDIKVLVKIYNYHSTNNNFKEAMLPYGVDVNLPKTINRITKLNKRNNFIVGLIKELTMEEGRKILVLSDRINHLESIKEILDKEKIINNDFYIGRMKQAKLDEASKKQIILGSYAMASEALDIPELNTLIMVTSRRNIEQSVGRILRKPDDKIQPIIIDINDKLGCFQRQGEFRKRYYLKKGYQVLNFDMKNNKIISEKEENLNNINKISYNQHKIDLDEIDFID